MVFSHKQLLEINITIIIASLLVDLDVEKPGSEVHKADKPDFSAARKLLSCQEKGEYDDHFKSRLLIS